MREGAEPRVRACVLPGRTENAAGNTLGARRPVRAEPVGEGVGLDGHPDPRRVTGETRSWGGARHGRRHAGHGDSRMSRRRIAACLFRGSLPLPHLGDWMQDGQPCSQSHEAIASRVAWSHSRARV